MQIHIRITLDGSIFVKALSATIRSMMYVNKQDSLDGFAHRSRIHITIRDYAQLTGDNEKCAL